MWITKQRAQTGTVFGFSDKFEGLGVFIDTYKNGRTGTPFPYVMAMLGDGKTPYDVDMDGKANEVGGCSVLRPAPNVPVLRFAVLWRGLLMVARLARYGRLRFQQWES